MVRNELNKMIVQTKLETERLLADRRLQQEYDLVYLKENNRTHKQLLVIIGLFLLSLTSLIGIFFGNSALIGLGLLILAFSVIILCYSMRVC